MNRHTASPLRHALTAALWALLAACPLAGAQAAGAPGPGGFAMPAVARDGREAPYLVARSPYTLEQTVAQVKAAAAGHNFRLIREQALDYGFVSPGIETTRGRTIYFCDFAMLNQALQVDRRIGLFLPCQVNVVEHGGDVLVVAPNPRVLSREFFKNRDLKGACEKLRETYAEIIDEATM